MEKNGRKLRVYRGLYHPVVRDYNRPLKALGIQSYSQLMIGMSNHLLSMVFRFHYHSQKVIGSLGKDPYLKKGSISWKVRPLLFFCGSAKCRSKEVQQHSKLKPWHGIPWNHDWFMTGSIRQCLMNGYLGDGFKYFLCSSLFGEMIHFDEHIFQMGWNHQPVLFRNQKTTGLAGHCSVTWKPQILFYNPNWCSNIPFLKTHRSTCIDYKLSGNRILVTFLFTGWLIWLYIIIGPGFMVRCYSNTWTPPAKKKGVLPSYGWDPRTWGWNFPWLHPLKLA